MNKPVYAVALSLLTLTATAQTKNFIDQPYIEVSATADSMVVPNKIFISITISESDTKGKVQVEEQEKKMFSKLKEMGLEPEKNLVARDQSSNFKSYAFKGKEVLKQRQYLLKVKTAKQTSDVFTALEQLDIANAQVDHVDHTDREIIKNLVLAKAVENAKLKAQTMVKPLGQTIGNAILITTSQNYNFADGMIANSISRRRGEESLDNTEMDFEMVRTSANVSVTFILK